MSWGPGGLWSPAAAAPTPAGPPEARQPLRVALPARPWVLSPARGRAGRAAGSARAAPSRSPCRGHMGTAGAPTLMRTRPRASAKPAFFLFNCGAIHLTPSSILSTISPAQGRRHLHAAPRPFPELSTVPNGHSDPPNTDYPSVPQSLVLGPPPPCMTGAGTSWEVIPAVNPRWKPGDAPRTSGRKQPPSAPHHPQPPGHLGPQVPRQLRGHHGDRRRQHQRALPQRATAQRPTPRTKGPTPRAGDAGCDRGPASGRHRGAVAHDARVPWRAGSAPGPRMQLPANAPGESAWAPATRVGDPGAAPGFGLAWSQPWRSSGE